MSPFFSPSAIAGDDATEGELESFDNIFSVRANASWGIAFVTTESVSAATDAVADAFAELFQVIKSGTAVENTHLEIIRITRRSAEATVASGTASGGQHAREPVSLLGETKEREATLALTALAEPQRSVLWLVDAERLSTEHARDILQSTDDQVTTNLRHARSNFRKYYVDATKREGLSIQCISCLDLLSRYIDKALVAGDQATVEAHLGECQSCRSVLNKLGDLESRLHAAIPPLPAWTRQYVMDNWAAVATAPVGASANPAPAKSRYGLARTLASVIAALLIAATTIFLLTYPNNDDDNPQETTSSQLAAPDNVTRSGPVDDNATVPTPTATPAGTSTTTTESADPNATSQNQSSAAGQATGSTGQPAGTAPASERARSSTTSTTAEPVTTTTQAGGLIDLPSAPGPTRPTSTTTSPVTSTTTAPGTSGNGRSRS